MPIVQISESNNNRKFIFSCYLQRSVVYKSYGVLIDIHKNLTKQHCFIPLFFYSLNKCTLIVSRFRANCVVLLIQW